MTQDAIAPADFVALATPLTPETRHFFGAEQLSWMRATAVLINVGRGPAIDEPALIDALQRGAIRGAALDVFETEPLPAASGLWDEPNVIVSPHGAGGRPLGAEDLIQANLAAFRAGRPLRNVVERP